MLSIRNLVHTLILALCFSSAAMAVTPTAQQVNINTADAATLDRLLDGVGPSKAQAIIDYRKANGAFRSPADLAKVKGIGPATVQRNAARISVGAAKAKPATPAKKPAAR
ncbi:ComEA family DNA-binding protein [Arenimonas sp. GDDSR-1]|uniref:ComEA family DNA-binding protein n=1 Tax=Arenimonas sp. GDDSR-1 TaxID=2950125 RepID=UPI002637333E|nr:ComEA family DNA-binding protein [Arenimonas sp. GDDSR-1]